MNSPALLSAVSAQWDGDIVAQLTDYVRIPAKSPHFDPQWKAHGHIERVIRLAEAWVKKQPVRGLTVEIVRLPDRTPLLYFDVPGAGNRTVLLYGHLDKQPEMSGWRAGFGPWDPLFEDGKLYGRGSADDGYAVFAALSAKDVPAVAELTSRLPIAWRDALTALPTLYGPAADVLAAAQI